MKRIFILLLVGLLISSCGASRKSTNTTVIGDSTSTTSSRKISKVIKHAKSFEGTRYKFGGTDSRGMDCSGLVYTSFLEEDIQLPRVSRDMAKRGVRINLQETAEGDLLFFQTNKNKKVINHVGLVVENDRGVIRFIHSTSSRGVIVSSLDERYWKNAFVQVRRVI